MSLRVSAVVFAVSLFFATGARASQAIKPCPELLVANPDVSISKEFVPQKRNTRIPTATKLRDENRKDLLEDIKHGASMLPNALMQKAWELNHHGVLAEDGDFDYVAFIRERLKSGLEINARDPFGRTALMHAAATGYGRYQAALLKMGARTDLIDFSNRTAADISMLVRMNGSVDTDLYYIERYFSLDGLFVGPELWAAYRKRDFERLRAYFKEGAYVDTFDREAGKSFLTYAAEENDMAMAKFLLDEGADPNFGIRNRGKNNYPVLMAAKNGYHEMIDLLVSYGARIDAKGFYAYDINPVRQVIWNLSIETNQERRNMDMLEWLLSKGADPNAHLALLPPAQRPQNELGEFIRSSFTSMGIMTMRGRQVEALLRKKGHL